jgi:hypothetical protein
LDSSREHRPSTASEEVSLSALLAIAERVANDESLRRELLQLDLGSVGDGSVRVLYPLSIIALAVAVTFAVAGSSGRRRGC